MTKYRAHFTNGGMATFHFDGDPENDLDAFLEAAYEEAPSGLCHHCANNFDVSGDMEVYDIVNTETQKSVYNEPTYVENLEKSNTILREENLAFRDKVQGMTGQLFALAEKLTQAGFTVDPDTFAVSR